MELIGLIIGVALVFLLIKRYWKSSDDLTTVMRRNAGAIEEYSRELGKFKNVTMEWVIANVGPLQELPRDIVIQLLTYLVEASSSACKYTGVDDRLRDSMSANLLMQMGFPKDTAVGMVEAISTPTSQLGNSLTYGQGESAFSAWVRDGDNAAEDHIRDAVEVWQRAFKTADEVSAVSNDTERDFQEYKGRYLEEIKRLDPDSVHKDMHWLQFADDEGIRKAFSNRVEPKALAKMILENTQITDMKF